MYDNQASKCIFEGTVFIGKELEGGENRNES